MEGMTFHETYGTVPVKVLRAIKRYNVTHSDWDMMLDRWGLSWDAIPDHLWPGIFDHIETHSAKGYYSWPMYG